MSLGKLKINRSEKWQRFHGTNYDMEWKGCCRQRRETDEGCTRTETERGRKSTEDESSCRLIDDSNEMCYIYLSG